ncbi:MAG: hypothetical protein DI539_26070 [Flavobacterium psychrophilum]|nr:MAG: hypothetical protein DI539_26070 [Flavobacterium psychrophilum]
MRERIYCLLSILWAVANSYAQSPPANIRPLTIGDTIPADLEISNVYNYPVSKIRLSELKGKLVILDFWATWCAACIKGFSKAEELQKQYPKDLVILLINTYEGDNEAAVNSFIEKRSTKKGERLSLPYSLQQASLQESFPHRLIPHYVWINRNGVVNAITDGTELTKENISKFVQGHPLIVKTKIDNPTYDRQKPLFVANNGGNDDEFQFRTILSGYKDGLGTNGGVSEMTEDRMRLYLVNYPTRYLLNSAYKEEMQVPANRIRYEADDTLATAALLDSLICYELIIPKKSWKNVPSIIKSDLERYLNIQVLKKSYLERCYLLRVGSNYLQTELPKSKKRNSSLTNSFQIVDSDSKTIITKLSSYLIYPVIDETNSNSKYTIALSNTQDLKQIIKDLEKSGLSLTEGEKSIEYSVVKQN